MNMKKRSEATIMYVLTKSSMRRAEEYVHENRGLSFYSMMDMAGSKSAAYIASRESKDARVCVLCGKGKNGEEGAVGEGIVEFFASNYRTQKKLADAGGSDKVYDCNYTPSFPGKGYGCMQVHNAKTGATIFSYNRFDGPADVGIGPNKGNDHTDWTFMGNAAEFTARRLTVLVK